MLVRQVSRAENGSRGEALVWVTLDLQRNAVVAGIEGETLDHLTSRKSCQKSSKTRGRRVQNGTHQQKLMEIFWTSRSDQSAVRTVTNGSFLFLHVEISRV